MGACVACSPTLPELLLGVTHDVFPFTLLLWPLSELESMVQYVPGTDREIMGGLPSQFSKRDSAFVFTVQTADRLLFLFTER